MKDVNYTLKYSNDDRKPVKILCLGFCILLDLIVLAGVIAAFSANMYFDLIIYAVIFLVALAIRILSLFFTFEVIIDYQNGKISITKKYPIKEVALFNDEKSQLKLNKFDINKEVRSRKFVSLCSKSCEDGVYMLELSGRKYLIYLDNYLYSLIEVNGDLS